MVHLNHLPSWMMHCEATWDLSHKQFSYKLLAIMMFKRSDYSLLKYLEDTGTVWRWKHKTMSLKIRLNVIFCLGLDLPSDFFSSGFLSASKQIWDRMLKQATIIYQYSMAHKLHSFWHSEVALLSPVNLNNSYHLICPVSYLKATMKNSIIWHFYFKIFRNGIQCRLT